MNNKKENKIIIVYKSSTGFTKRYAQFIAKRLNCAIADFKSVTPQLLSQYQSVIFGSRAHAGTIDSLPKARKLFEKSAIRPIALFVTGAMPSDMEETIQQFWQQNLTTDELQKLPHFYMPGGLCYEKMSIIDKLMMKAFTEMLKKKKDKTDAEKELERVIQKSYDISSKEYIEPLITHLKSEHFFN